MASKEEDLEERQAALTLKEIRMAQLLIECETLRARQDSEREFQRKENASAASDLLVCVWLFAACSVITAR